MVNDSGVARFRRSRRKLFSNGSNQLSEDMIFAPKPRPLPHDALPPNLAELPRGRGDSFSNEGRRPLIELVKRRVNGEQRDAALMQLEPGMPVALTGPGSCHEGPAAEPSIFEDSGCRYRDVFTRRSRPPPADEQAVARICCPHGFDDVLHRAVHSFEVQLMVKVPGHGDAADSVVVHTRPARNFKDTRRSRAREAMNCFGGSGLRSPARGTLSKSIAKRFPFRDDYARTLRRTSLSEIGCL